MSWPFLIKRDAEGWPMHQFCIYENPADAKPGYPFIVRRWEIGAVRRPGFCSVVPREALSASTLDAARALIPEGLVQTGPGPEDDPCVKEVWT